MPTSLFCRIQTLFALLQSAAVITGSLVVALGLRIGGALEGNESRLWPLPFFIWQFGFLFILIPIGWVIATLWAKGRWASWFSSRWTIATGISVLLSPPMRPGRVPI